MPDSDLPVADLPVADLTLGELASEVRSKNAGPFWVTLDVFFASEPDYLLAVNSGVLSGETISSLYQVDPVTVKYFELPGIRAVKISFPRPVTAGSFEDRDLHAGQQHVPLAGLRLTGITRRS
jgi:Domain of unknown function (DUF4387)